MVHQGYRHYTHPTLLLLTLSAVAFDLFLNITTPSTGPEWFNRPPGMSISTFCKRYPYLCRFNACPDHSDWSGTKYNVQCKATRKCEPGWESSDGFCVHACQPHFTRDGVECMSVGAHENNRCTCTREEIEDELHQPCCGGDDHLYVVDSHRSSHVVHNGHIHFEQHARYKRTHQINDMDAYELTSFVDTSCQTTRKAGPGRDDTVNVAAPKCDVMGEWDPKQCKTDTARNLWCTCVDKDGMQVDRAPFHFVGQGHCRDSAGLTPPSADRIFTISVMPSRAKCEAYCDESWECAAYAYSNIARACTLYGTQPPPAPQWNALSGDAGATMSITRTDADPTVVCYRKTPLLRVSSFTKYVRYTGTHWIRHKHDQHPHADLDHHHIHPGEGITGMVVVDEQQDGALRISYDLDLNEASATGGIHIHRGKDCTVDTGPDWRSTAANPWAQGNSATYTTDDDMHAAGSFTVASGFKYASNVGRTVVIFDSQGKRMACGVLKDAAPADTPGLLDAGWRMGQDAEGLDCKTPCEREHAEALTKLSAACNAKAESVCSGECAWYAATHVCKASSDGEKFISKCTAAGAFAPKQCERTHSAGTYNSTKVTTVCWCVDYKGVEIHMSRGIPNGGDYDYDHDADTVHCDAHEHRTLHYVDYVLPGDSKRAVSKQHWRITTTAHAKDHPNTEDKDQSTSFDHLKATHEGHVFDHVKATSLDGEAKMCPASSHTNWWDARYTVGDPGSTNQQNYGAMAWPAQTKKIKQCPSRKQGSIVLAKDTHDPDGTQKEGAVGTCTFPFTHKTTTYHTCAQIAEFGGVGWCAFDTNYQPGKWGFCTPTCAIQADWDDRMAWRPSHLAAIRETGANWDDSRYKVMCTAPNKCDSVTGRPWETVDGYCVATCRAPSHQSVCLTETHGTRRLCGCTKAQTEEPDIPACCAAGPPDRIFMDAAAGTHKTNQTAVAAAQTAYAAVVHHQLSSTSVATGCGTPWLSDRAANITTNEMNLRLFRATCSTYMDELGTAKTNLAAARAALDQAEADYTQAKKEAYGVYVTSVATKETHFYTRYTDPINGRWAYELPMLKDRHGRQQGPGVAHALYFATGSNRWHVSTFEHAMHEPNTDGSAVLGRSNTGPSCPDTAAWSPSEFRVSCTLPEKTCCQPAPGAYTHTVNMRTPTGDAIKFTAGTDDLAIAAGRSGEARIGASTPAARWYTGEDSNRNMHVLVYDSNMHHWELSYVKASGTPANRWAGRKTITTSASYGRDACPEDAHWTGAQYCTCNPQLFMYYGWWCDVSSLVNCSASLSMRSCNPHCFMCVCDGIVSLPRCVLQAINMVNGRGHGGN